LKYLIRKCESTPGFKLSWAPPLSIAPHAAATGTAEVNNQSIHEVLLGTTRLLSSVEAIKLKSCICFALAHFILTSSIIRHKFRADAVVKQAPWEPARFIRKYVGFFWIKKTAMLCSSPTHGLWSLEPYVFWLYPWYGVQ